MMDTILFSIEYYGNCWWKENYFVAPLLEKWHRVSWQSEHVFFFIDFFEEKKNIQEGKARGIKKEQEYNRAAMTANIAAMFAAPRVNIAGLCIF